jgi:hypothetical protein
MEQLIHITATYSNALLVAILPHVSDFAKKLELPVQLPVTTEQVARFNPMPYQGHMEGALWLTNGDWFLFTRSYVDGFRVPKNWFYELDYATEHIDQYVGQTRMTTNEILALARTNLLKLGYPPEITHADSEPQWTGPSDLKGGGHIPYCQLRWAPIKDQDSDGYSDVKVLINTEQKTLVGLYLGFSRTNRMQIGKPLSIDVEPELESDFRKGTAVKPFVRTNAPASPK